ncbi:unnamed protein product [Leuciscus chuanchicus]
MADRSLICQQPVTPPRPRVLPRASTANFSLLLAKHTHTHIQDVCAPLGTLLPPLAHLFKALVWVLAMLKCLAGWARADMERERVTQSVECLNGLWRGGVSLVISWLATLATAASQERQLTTATQSPLPARCPGESVYLVCLLTLIWSLNPVRLQGIVGRLPHPNLPGALLSSYPQPPPSIPPENKRCQGAKIVEGPGILLTEMIDIWLSVVDFSQPLCPSNLSFSIYGTYWKMQADGWHDNGSLTRPSNLQSVHPVTITSLTLSQTQQHGCYCPRDISCFRTSQTGNIHYTLSPQLAYTHCSGTAHIRLVIRNLELYATDATSHRSRAHFRQLSLALCTPLKWELINTEPQGVFEPHCLDLIAWALCFCTN